MSETQKINFNKSSTSKVSGSPTKQTVPTFEEKIDKKAETRKAFTGLTYANSIIALIAFVFTIVALFGANSYSHASWWVGFWKVNTAFGGNPTFLSSIGITAIVIDSIAFTSILTQVFANIVLKNKIRLMFVTRISWIILAATLLMLILGLCSKPSFSLESDVTVVYISWIRYLTRLNDYEWTTHLSSGAIVILIQMVLVICYCIGYVIFWCVVKTKAEKDKKSFFERINNIKNKKVS